MIRSVPSWSSNSCLVGIDRLRWPAYDALHNNDLWVHWEIALGFMFQLSLAAKLSYQFDLLVDLNM